MDLASATTHICTAWVQVRYWFNHCIRWLCHICCYTVRWELYALWTLVGGPAIGWGCQLALMTMVKMGAVPSKTKYKVSTLLAAKLPEIIILTNWVEVFNVFMWLCIWLHGWVCVCEWCVCMLMVHVCVCDYVCMWVVCVCTVVRCCSCGDLQTGQLLTIG